jgi:dienelactone hydrolase
MTARHAAGAASKLVVAGLLTSCAARDHTPFRPGDEVAPPLLRVAASEFDYLASAPHPTDRLDGEEPDYWVRSLAMPSVGVNGQPGNLVTARYYHGKRAGSSPLVIVLPIWGLHDYPSETIARGLRGRSGGAINVLQILGDQPLFDWQAISDVNSEAAFFGRIDQMVERFVATVIDIRRLIDWAEGRPEVDAGRIALIGFSISAVVASVTIAHEPRLAAGIPVMGGADLHEILASCNREIAAARERILARLDWSVERFRRELRRELAGINPARFAGMADPRRVLIIEAGADTCMPQSARDRLWHALGRPERIAYRYDHRPAFLAMTFLGGHDLQRQVYRFLDRTLAAPSDQQLTEDEGAPVRGGRAEPG